MALPAGPTQQAPPVRTSEPESPVAGLEAPTTAPETPTTEPETEPEAQPESAPAAEPPPQPVDPTTQAVRAQLRRSAWRAPHVRIVKAVYDELAGGPAFHDGLALTPQAMQLVRAVEDLERHAIDRGPYQLGFTAALPFGCRRATRRGKCAPRSAGRAVSEAPARNARSAAKRDLRLVNAAIQYVLDFQVLYKAHPHESGSGTQRRNVARAQGDVVAAVLRILKNPQEATQALWPAHPQYQALLSGLVRYQALAARAREMPRITTRSVRGIAPGVANRGVESLQKRLAFEGYLEESAQSGVFDQPTIDAIKLFQSTHQLPESGEVGYRTRHAMNVAMRYRVNQIKVGLQRWRESLIHREGLQEFVRVNIPHFHLTFYRDGEVVRTHRVIVGNNKLDFHQGEWKQGYMNRTPVQKTRVVKVILYPVWIVPARIREQEFDGAERVIQGAGPDNPLGVVKFTLERTGGVFMHDTNRRRKFENTRRAYSHGCVRVQHADQLAEFVLTKVVGLSQNEYEDLIAARQTSTVIKLERDLPVYIEYNTMEVTDDGRMVFLGDIYKYDNAYLRDKVPVNNVVRYGSRRYRPAQVPLIPDAAYRRLRAEGAMGPLVWPPADQATAAPTVEGAAPTTEGAAQTIEEAAPAPTLAPAPQN